MSDEPREPRSLRYHDLSGARPLPAGKVLAIGVLALTIAAVLNADGLYELASRQPVGWKRDTARAAIAPACFVGRVTRLKDLRGEIRDATGKTSSDCSHGNRSGADSFVGPDRSGAPEATTTQPGQTTEPPVVARTPTAEDPLRVWMIGDSMSFDLIQAVERASVDRPELRLDSHSQVSSGLSRPDFFDWPRYITDEVLPDRPEVVVVLFGANDSQDLEIDGNVYEPSDEEWRAEYRRRVGVTMDMLRGDGRLVVWVGLPHMRESAFEARMASLNDIYSSEAASRPWVTFVDSGPVLSPDGGAGFQAESGDKVLRHADGIHLAWAGADLMAAAVMATIDERAIAAAPPR